MTILISAGILFILPFIFIGMLFINKFKSKLEWLLDVVVTFLLVSWLYQASAWSWIGYYFRFVMVGLLMIAIIYSWGKVRKLPFKIHEKKKISFIVNIILIFVFGLYNIFVLTSYSTNATKLELDFPMAEGTYFIGQGGDHVQMNYHQSYEPQQYALDIVALNTLGTRAKGFYPKDLDRYEIFGHAIVSPCAGVVTEMENGLPDLTPPEADPEHATGNYVALVCDHAADTTLYLAHLQEGSVLVENGDTIEAGQLLGKVGNSGNTSEPHLHIHAEKNGVGVPLAFDDRFLVRNQLVRTN